MRQKMRAMPPYDCRQRPPTTTTTVHGQRRRRYSEDNNVRKGPWKAEEDEVLLNHVKKYGPRDWSSIRSKGLLRRTGKSCRLRWVNKLRPNLKSCKFSKEEERVVIQLQAQFGNKWAKIATYLTGRTDNDVKNFWSSRQKRFARMLQAPTAPHPKPNSQSVMASSSGNIDHVPMSDHALEMPQDTSSMEDKDPTFTFKSQSSLFSAYIDHEPQPIQMLALPSLMNPSMDLTTSIINQHQLTTRVTTMTSELDLIPFPQYATQPQPEQQLLSFPLESQDQLLAPLKDQCFMDMFGHSGSSQLLADESDNLLCYEGEQGLFFAQEGEGSRSSCNAAVMHRNGDVMKNPETLFDDFPSDYMFDDQIEGLDHLDSLP